MSTFGLSGPMEGIVGMVLAAANTKGLPARVWPLTAALESLASDTSLSDDVRRTTKAAVGPLGDAAVEEWVLDLARAGLLRPHGRGLEALWAADTHWLRGWGLVYEALGPSESAAYGRAARVFRNCLSIWEKAAAAAASES